MTQENGNEEVKPLQAVSSEAETLVIQTIDDIFEIDMPDVLPAIEKKIKQLNPQEAGEAYDRLHVALQALWHFFYGLQCINEKADWIKAHESFVSAVSGFNAIGHIELRDLSIGFGVYSEASIELQKYNFSQALDLIANVKKYLDSAGEFGSRYRQFLDQMEPDALFLAGAKALMELDFGNGKTLIEKASQSAEKIATQYYEKGSPLYNTFKGLARYHKAYYTYVKVSADFDQFKFDDLLAEKELLEDAVQAEKLLSQGDLQNEVVRSVYNLSCTILDLLRAVSGLAVLMNNILRSSFKPAPIAFLEIKKRISAASDSAAKAGVQAASMVRMCTQLSERANNLERLAKPSKKDFGVFSGLIASALFLPLFLVVSWSNAAFSIGLNPTTLITSCLVLALIAGFGFGALRFKDLILPAPTSG